MRRSFPYVAALSLALVILAPMGVGAQQQPDPGTAVRAWVETFNSGDIDEFASYLSDDSTATGFCRPAGVCHSKAEIIAATSAEIAEGVHAEIRSLTVNGNTVVVQLTEAAPSFAQLGIERVYIDLVVTVVNGKVTTFDDQFDVSDSQTARFVRALEGESQQPSAVPSTGDGSALVPHTTELSPLNAVLFASGAALLVIGAALANRRRSMR